MHPFGFFMQRYGHRHVFRTKYVAVVVLPSLFLSISVAQFELLFRNQFGKTSILLTLSLSAVTKGVGNGALNNYNGRLIFISVERK